MKNLRWVSRVPGTLTAAQMLLEDMPEVAFNDSAIPGYRIAPSCSEYGGVRQSWLVVESQARKEADKKQLEKRLIKKLSLAQSELRQLLNQEFACSKDSEKLHNGSVLSCLYINWLISR
jgi:transposase